MGLIVALLLLGIDASIDARMSAAFAYGAVPEEVMLQSRWSSRAYVAGVRRPSEDPRWAPRMDANRKVIEVDCSKPFDATAGNIRCR